jgi:broad specificity phosphatase PhoE
MADRPPEIVLVRHGETEWSASGRHTGTTDLDLTALGRRQASGLRTELGRWRFSSVLTSPLRRAVDTCALAGLGDHAEVRPDLAEWDYGDAEGRTTSEIRTERPGWSVWRDGPPGGETVDEVGRRADRILAEVAAAGGDVVLFSHGHLLRVLAARWIDLPPTGGAHLALDPATVSVLGYERETPVLLRWNGVPA